MLDDVLYRVFAKGVIERHADKVLAAACLAAAAVPKLASNARSLTRATKTLPFGFTHQNIHAGSSIPPCWHRFTRSALQHAGQDCSPLCQMMQSVISQHAALARNQLMHDHLIIMAAALHDWLTCTAWQQSSNLTGKVQTWRSAVIEELQAQVVCQA